MESPWINGDFVFNMNDNLMFEKDEKNYIDAVGVNELNTIGNIYFLDIYLERENSVEFHYHPNASELTYCIEGEAEIGFINPSESEWESFLLTPGDVISIPKGFWHFAVAKKDNTHLLAAHDTNNLQTMFGSDILRLSPKQLMADTYCLDEQKLEEVLDPIDDTVIIGPPSDCERKSEEVSKEMRMERPKLMEQQGFEMLSASLENESEKVGRRKEEGAEEKKSVSYGGTVVKEMNVCESCMKKFSR